MFLTVITKEKIRKYLISLFVIFILLVHTSWVGRIVNELFLFIPVLGILLLLFVIEKGLRLTVSKLIIFCLSIFFVLWISLQTVFLNPSSWYSTTSVIVGILLSVVGSAFFVKNRDLHLVLKTIVIFVVVLSLSQLITFAFYFVGLGEMTQIMVVDTAERFGENAVLIQPLKWYFPYTFTAHFAKVNDFVFPRAIGMWREPGLYQMFVIISYFSLDFIKIGYKKFWRIILISSLICVFSTTGFVLFLACLIYKNIFLQRKNYMYRLVIFTITIVLGMMLMSTTATFGLQKKLDINWKRFQTPQISFNLLLERPLLGYSLFGDIPPQAQTQLSNIGSGETSLGINLLSSVHKFGLVGLCLYFGMILFSILQFYDIKTLILIIPVLVTLLIAQPIATTPFVFLMLFLPARYLMVSNINQVNSTNKGLGKSVTKLACG